MSQKDIEHLIVEKELTAPRVSLKDIEDNIKKYEIVKHISSSGQVLRWAVIIANNGFSVVGKPSVSVSPENDNAEIGERIALENSKSEMWALMGYELKSKLMLVDNKEEKF